MKKKSYYPILMGAILMAMALIYYLTSLLANNWPEDMLTINYFKWFVIALIGIVFFFREISVWEIYRGQLIITETGPHSKGFSPSIALLDTAWFFVFLFIILFAFSFFDFFSNWVTSFLKGPINLTLIAIFSLMTMIAIALMGSFFWESVAKKKNKEMRKARQNIKSSLS